MAHILLASDLSERSDRALARAFRMAASQDATLTALHVVDGDLPVDLSRRLVSEAKTHLERFCAAQVGADKVTWSARVDRGDPAADIHAVAEELGADLIVTGLHRRRAFFDSWRETTLGYLVRMSAHPVLLVAEPADHEYRRVLAPIDFSPAATAALNAAHRWAPGAEIRAFHAVHAAISRMDAHDPGHVMAKAHVHDVEDAARRWADAGGLPPNIAAPRVIEGGIGTVLDHERQAFDPDLIAIGAHARHALERRVLGSFARDMVRDPPTDLLITRPA
ncbi:MAG: universal stress protein [Pseudomonadota bacterium]